MLRVGCSPSWPTLKAGGCVSESHEMIPANIAELLPRILIQLADVDGPDQLSHWSHSFDELVEPTLISTIQLMSADPFAREVVLALMTLLNAREDAASAWSDYKRQRTQISEDSQHLQALLESVVAAAGSTSSISFLDEIQDAISFAQRTGHVQAFALLYFIKGDHFWRTTEGHRAQNIESAIDAYLEGFETARATPNLSFVAEYAQRLAVAYGERLLGDQMEDLPKSEQLLVEVLRVLPGSEKSLIAMSQTNLAVVLLRTFGGDPTARLIRARDLCTGALQYRRPNRDSADWAFSELTLGDIERCIATIENRPLIAALRSYKKVISHRRRIGAKNLVSAAYHRLARLRLQLLEAADTGDQITLQMLSKGIDTTNLLTHALTELNLAHELSEDDPYLTALVQVDISLARKRANDIPASIEAGLAALSYLQPTVDPTSCHIIAQSLGDTFATLGRWHESANIFSLGVDACERLYRVRVNSATRESEIRAFGNIHRWTAFALARAGHTDRAVEILELGRARELRDREPLNADEVHQIGELPDELLSRFQTAVAELSTAPFGSAASATVRKYQLLLVEVRRHIGDESITRAWNLDDIGKAVTSEWPLIYVNPTPWGTVLLSVSKVGSEVIAKASFTETTSLHVYLRMMLGPFDPTGPPDNAQAISYVLNASEGGDEVDRSLELLLPWLGEHIARQIAALDEVTHAQGVSLVTCGPIGAAPIHAALWIVADGTHSLIDQLPVRYCPSASALVSSLRRLQESEASIRLLTLGNPEPNDPATALPGAESEITAIVRIVGANRSRSALGEAASAAFLLSNCEWATHLHLACHGTAGLFDGVSRIYLSDRSIDLRGPELLPALSARLTVLSACQTAVIPTIDLSDEMLSIGTALLSAGSACVIASLWPVADSATALLFARFYEKLVNESKSPAAALRDAQLWLRSASQEEILRYAKDYPELGMVMPVYADCPYADPIFWAAFIVIGV